ncbi:MAG: GYD domain protein [Acidobacteria bacterium]|nr:MAG: GYD domain protein [Acidobacteriota bacterium]PYR18585.1 MAG: GYD domain protein [Acidobacteriota bacterium]PYR44901.1 MAG: GYD domain protein [Acidobacteriota bacterium]
MAKYLLVASYTPEGAKGVMKDGGTKRRQAAEAAVKSAGGKLEAFYFAFGDNDAYVIVDAPDNASVAGMSLTISASGAVNTKTVVLLTPEEIDQASRKGTTYTAPGH